MRRRTLSKTLLTSGAVLGVVTTVGWMAGFDPTPLSPALITIALYKLTYIAAGGMLVAGALVGRGTRRDPSSAGARQLTDRVSGVRQLGNDGGLENFERAIPDPRADASAIDRKAE